MCNVFSRHRVKRMFVCSDLDQRKLNESFLFSFPVSKPVIYFLIHLTLVLYCFSCIPAVTPIILPYACCVVLPLN